MTPEAVSFEQAFHWTKSWLFKAKNIFHWHVSRKLWFKFNAKINYDIQVKLVFLWNTLKDFSQCILALHH